MQDKIARYLNISKKGLTITNEESLSDTLVDLMNYANMAYMLINEDKLNHPPIHLGEAPMMMPTRKFWWHCNAQQYS